MPTSHGFWGEKAFQLATVIDGSEEVAARLYTTTFQSSFRTIISSSLHNQASDGNVVSIAENVPRYCPS
jgi:hypothetical protein